MDFIKKFFKPGWRKILIVLILMIVPIFQIINAMRIDRPGVKSISLALTPIFIAILFPIVLLDLLIASFPPYRTLFTAPILIYDVGYGVTLTFLGLIVSIIYLYFISCLIVWIYDKVKKK